VARAPGRHRLAAEQLRRTPAECQNSLIWRDSIPNAAEALVVVEDESTARYRSLPGSYVHAIRRKSAKYDIPVLRVDLRPVDLAPEQGGR
jgi:hypothetical protein